MALFAVSTMTLLVLAVWWTAHWLDQVDGARRAAEDALARSEERLRAILDNTTAVVSLKDPQGRLLFVNRRFEELFHVTREQAVGRIDHDLFPGELADASRTNDVRVLETRTPLEFEERVVHGDGIHTYVSVKFPLVDANGVPYALCGVSTDITARIRMEEALRESDERLNLALGSSGVGTWSWDIVADAIVWDDYIHPLYGLAPGTFGGRYDDFVRLVHADDRERVTREIERAVEEGTPYDTEFRVVWPDGSVHVLGARGKVYRDDAGRPVRMTGVCTDISERKRAEEQLRERGLQLEAANEALGSFTYSVSTTCAPRCGPSTAMRASSSRTMPTGSTPRASASSGWCATTRGRWGG